MADWLRYPTGDKCLLLQDWHKTRQGSDNIATSMKTVTVLLEQPCNKFDSST